MFQNGSFKKVKIINKKLNVTIKFIIEMGEKMKIKVIASTKVGYELPKEEAVDFSGKISRNLLFTRYS